MVVGNICGDKILMFNKIKQLILANEIKKLLKELLMNVDERFTSRKFWLVVGVLVTSYALTWKELLPVTAYLEWVKWVLIAYLGANTLEKFTQ